MNINAASFIPVTGDTANITLWLVLFAACLVGAAVTLLALFRRKNKAKGKHYK